ncbi:PKD domain-containing protein [Kitasatospora sp. NPDC088346]|uniref:PKD domain-containing protein n=1 Tax=Kitasatospora sp. NPDC088346 TaxID=3364073 RepID=UPI00381F51DE
MPIRRTLGLTAAVATALLAGPVPAFAAPATTLYVDGVRSHCSDSGQGTQAVPFCTVAAAAAVVVPGQTVQLAPGRVFEEQVRLTRSGTPDQPITFVGGLPGRDDSAVVGTATGAFVLSGVHDVVLRQIVLRGDGDRVAVEDSSRVTVDGTPSDGYNGTGTIRISGQSDHVTVSRNHFHDDHGVTVEAGVRDTVITTNDFARTRRAVLATDAPGVVAVHNTVAFSCGPGIALEGASTGAVVENNVLSGHNERDLTMGAGPDCGPEGGPGSAEVSVAAGSTAGTTVDHNVVHPRPGAAVYSWSGTAYATPAAFNAATGQGRHDVDQDVEFELAGQPMTDRLTDQALAAIDSADPSAPGALPTDLTGTAALDSPLVAHSGTVGFRDRGAYELQGLRSVSLRAGGATVPTPTGPAPFTARLVAEPVNAWPTKLGYRYDFGDGSTPLVTTATTVDHVYTTVGVYKPTVTVTDDLGGRVVGDPLVPGIAVNADGPLRPTLTAVPGTTQLSVQVNAAADGSPWQVSGYTTDFGDGTTATGASGYHVYARPGTYTVTVTARDEAGRTASTSQGFTAEYDDHHKDLLTGERVDVLAGTSGSGIFAGQLNYTRGTRQPFAGLADLEADHTVKNTPSMAAAYTANGDLHAVRALGNSVQVADWRPSDLHWQSPWATIPRTSPFGNQTVTEVAAATIGDKLHVLALAGGRIYQVTYDFGIHSLSEWAEVTAATDLRFPVTRIAAATTGNSLHVAALGTDGHLRIADGNYDRGTWSNGDLTAYRGGPSGVTQLSAASIGGSFHLLALAGGSIHQATADYTAGTWTNWANVSDATGLGGSVTRLSAATTGNTLHLYGVSNGHVHNANGDYTAGRWSAWSDVSSPDAHTSLAPVTTVAAAGR